MICLSNLTVRERTEQQELVTLSEYACKATQTKGRDREEKSHTGVRNLSLRQKEGTQQKAESEG